MINKNFSLVICLLLSIFLGNCTKAMTKRIKPNKVLQNTIFSAPISRSIVNVAHLKNTYDIVKQNKRHLSPLYGAAFFNSNNLKNLYLLSHEEGHNNSATAKLMDNLFYLKKNHFHATENKSNPGYSLDPELTGQILHHLEQNDLELPQNYKAIAKKWKEKHKQLGMRVTEKKVDQIINNIIGANKEAQKGEYLPFTTRAILLGFLYSKADTKKQLFDYLRSIDNSENILENNQQTQLTDCLNDNYTIGQLNNAAIPSGYEPKLCSLMIQSPETFLKVEFQHYRFKNSISRPNCVESSFFTIYNMLLYDISTNKFNFDMLPSGIIPIEEFKDFYARQKFQVYEINTRKIGQAWMDIVSGRSFLEYMSGEFELASKAQNFIKLTNYLMGIDAQDLEDLGNKLSDERRTVTFTVDELKSNGTITVVNVLIKEGQKIVYDYTMDLNNDGGHVDYYFKNHAIELKASKESEPTNNLWQSAIEGDQEDAALYLFKPNIKALEKDKEYSLDKLRYFYTSVNLNSKRDVSFLLNSRLSKNISELELFLSYILKQIPKEAPQAALETLSLLLENYPDEAERWINLLWGHKDYQDKDRTSVLIAAAFYGYEKIVQLLLSLQANPNIEDKFKQTALIHAASNGYTNIVKLLLNAGANVNVKTVDGDTALSCAIPGKYEEIILLLINAGADVNNKNKRGNTILIEATATGSKKIVELIINAGADVNIKDWENYSALMIAAAIGHKEITEMLINAGANVNEKDTWNTVLMIAASRGHKEIVQILIDAGAEIDAKTELDTTALIDATITQRKEIVEFLLEMGANVNASDYRKFTALMYAALRGHKELVQMLIKAGADVTAKTNNGDTALSLISNKFGKEYEEIKELLKATANVQENKNCTVLTRNLKLLSDAATGC